MDSIPRIVIRTDLTDGSRRASAASSTSSASANGRDSVGSSRRTSNASATSSTSTISSNASPGSSRRASNASASARECSPILTAAQRKHGNTSVSNVPSCSREGNASDSGSRRNVRSKDTVDICDGNSGDDFVDSEPSQAVAVNKKTIAKTPTKQNEVRGKTANLRKCPMVVFADNSSKARARQRSKLRKEASDVHNWETITERQQQEKLLEAKSEPNDDGEVVVLCDESEWSEQSGEKSQDVSADELDAADDGVIRNEQGFVIESKRQAKQECRTPYTTSEIARFHDIDSELKKCTTANAANPNLGADHDAVCTELAERMAAIYDNASHSAQETKRQIDENELAFKNEIDEYALASKNKMQREMDKMQREIDETALVFKKKFEEY